jgi:hypothetical protein
MAQDSGNILKVPEEDLEPLFKKIKLMHMVMNMILELFFI